MSSADTTAPAVARANHLTLVQAGAQPKPGPSEYDFWRRLAIVGTVELLAVPEEQRSDDATALVTALRESVHLDGRLPTMLELVEAHTALAERS